MPGHMGFSSIRHPRLTPRDMPSASWFTSAAKSATAFGCTHGFPDNAGHDLAQAGESYLALYYSPLLQIGNNTILFWDERIDEISYLPLSNTLVTLHFKEI